MGNVLSDHTGQNRLESDTNTFYTTINDILLELDLYNKPKGSNNLRNNKSEINFKSMDAAKNGNKYVDINNFNYTTADVNNIDSNSKDSLYLDPTANTPNSEKWRKTDKLFNIKRGMCNASNVVPVTMVGVDLPQDKREKFDVASNKYIYVTDQSNYNDPVITNFPSNWFSKMQSNYDVMTTDELDNCLKYGTLNSKSTYVCDNIPYWFVDSKRSYLDNSMTTNISSTAYVYVDSSSKIELLPNNSVPIAYFNSPCFVTLGDIPDELINSYLNNKECVGFYIIKNGTCTRGATTPCSEVLMYPLMISKSGTDYIKSIPGYTEDNKLSYMINFLLNGTGTSTNKVNNILSSTFSDAIALNNSEISTINKTPKKTKLDLYIGGSKKSSDVITPENSTASIYASVPHLIYTVFLKKEIKPVDLKVPEDIIDPKFHDLNNYVKENVYGNPVSPECETKLSNLLTHSYTNATINKWSKLNTYLKPMTNTTNNTLDKMKKNFESTAISNMTFVENINSDGTNTIGFYDKSDATAIGSKYDTGIATASANQTASAINGVSPQCDTFYNELCEYYYYYDFVDGIKLNTDASFKELMKKPELIDNIRFVTESLPDCRCNNSLVVKTVPNMSAQKYFQDTRCETSNRNKTDRNYGYRLQYDAAVGDTSSGFTSGNFPLLYNSRTQKKNRVGYKTQFDPSEENILLTNMSDKKFIYASNSRGDAITNNTYTCTINNNINVSETGGNVTVAGINLACNMGSATGSGSASGSGSGSGSGSAQASGSGSGSGAGAGAVSSTSNNSVSIAGTYTKSSSNPVSLSRLYDDGFTIPTLNLITINPSFQNDVYNLNFVSYNYKFVYISSADSTKKYLVNVKQCTTNSGDDTTKVCRSPMLVPIPFIYGPFPPTNIRGNKYILGIDSPSTNPIINSKTESVLVREYSMSITSIRLYINSTGPYIQFSIDLNCDNSESYISNLSYRIILTDAANKSAPPITIAGLDFFSAVLANINTNTDSNADGYLSIGGDGNTVLQQIKYNYEIRLNETRKTNTNPITYTDGVSMIYDVNMPKIDQGVADFSALVSKFTLFTLSYKDYENNNNVVSFNTNSTTPIPAKLAVTCELKWNFISIEPTLIGQPVNIYYKENSSTAVEVKLGSVTTGNSYSFIMPIFSKATNIFIYAKVEKDTKVIQSPQISIMTATIGTSFNNWAMISDKKLESSTILSIPNNTNPTIIDYFKYSMDPTTSPAISLIQYDFTTSKWYSTSNSTIPSGTQTNSGNYIIFKKPTLPTITIVLDPAPTAPIKYGDLVSIKYTLSNTLENPAPMQILVGGIIIDTFQILPTDGFSKTITFNLNDKIGTTSGQVPLLLTSYDIFKSNSLSLNISNDISAHTINAVDNLIASIPFPIFKVVGTPNTNTLKNIALTIDNPLTTQTTGLSNIYTCVLNNFAPVLSINTASFILNNVNYNKNIEFVITNSATASFTNVLPMISNGLSILPNSMNEQFTNISPVKNYNIYDSNKITNNYNTNNKFKLIEGLTGSNEIHLYTLKLDFSKTISTITKDINILLRFNQYNVIDIINLELLFGSANLNNTNFSITCISDSSNPNISIKNIRLVGNMTTSVFFSKKIPGLLHVYNSPNTLDASNIDNNGWSISTRLIELNGQYSIPEKLANVTVPTDNASSQGSGSGSSSSSGSGSESASSSAADESSNSSGSYLVIIFIILLILVLIGVGAYFYLKKKK